MGGGSDIAGRFGWGRVGSGQVICPRRGQKGNRKRYISGIFFSCLIRTPPHLPVSRLLMRILSCKDVLHIYIYIVLSGDFAKKESRVLQYTRGGGGFFLVPASLAASPYSNTNTLNSCCGSGGGCPFWCLFPRVSLKRISAHLLRHDLEKHGVSPLDEQPQWLYMSSHTTKTY